MNDYAARERVNMDDIAHICITVQEFPCCLPFHEVTPGSFDAQTLVRTDVQMLRSQP